MLANLQERVEQLARMAVLSDPGGLPGLVALQEQAVSLAADLDEEHAEQLSDLARRIGELAEAIVRQSVPSAEAAMDVRRSTCSRRSGLTSSCST